MYQYTDIGATALSAAFYPYEAKATLSPYLPQLCTSAVVPEHKLAYARSCVKNPDK